MFINTTAIAPIAIERTWRFFNLSLNKRTPARTEKTIHPPA